MRKITSVIYFFKGCTVDQHPQQLPITTDSKNFLKKSKTNENGVFAQICEIEIEKTKKLFAEKWSQEKRICRIPLSEKIESIPKGEFI